MDFYKIIEALSPQVLLFSLHTLHEWGICDRGWCPFIYVTGSEKIAHLAQCQNRDIAQNTKKKQTLVFSYFNSPLSSAFPPPSCEF